MDGFLETGRGGLTELRIHGVAGLPDDALLGHPHPKRVAGDGSTGFYRRWWPGGEPTCDDRDIQGVRRRESYGWGRLNLGRALWLLLLPFTLVNVAFFMMPRHPVRAVRLLSHAVQRVFALSLTGTFLLAAATATMDLIGWQCAARDVCRNADLPWMTLPAVADPAVRLALTSLVPASLLVILWLLGRATWRRHERRPVAPGGSDGGPLLGRRRMWNGSVPVGRLRSLHLGLGFALIVMFVAAPAPGPAGRLLVAGAWLVIVLAVMLALVPGSARRTDPEVPTDEERQARTLDPPRDRLTLICVAVRAAGLAIYVAAVAAALTGALDVRHAPGTLPGFVPVNDAWFLGQIVLLALVLATIRPTGPPAALFGLGGLGALALAWFLAGGVGSGVTFRMASSLGTPGFPGEDGIVVPAANWWGSIAAVGIIAGIVLAVGVLLLVRWVTTRVRLRADLADHYGASADNVAKTWALARLTDSAGSVLGLAMAIGLAAIGVAAVRYFGAPEDPPAGFAARIADTGSWLMGAGVVGIVVLGRYSYQNETLRRTIGVIWDLGTFWPRATHPLAAPCYAERVLPDLMERVTWLAPRESDRVVLTGYSQGSVLAAAVVCQGVGRVRLLTLGSPLARLYGRYFPAYFGDLGVITVPWRNLYRPSDPLGGPVRRDVPLEEAARRPRQSRPIRPIAAPGDEVDTLLWDPPRPASPDGPPGWTLGHGDYFEDPAYDSAFRTLSSPLPA